MSTPLNQKPAMAAWIVRERKRLKLKPADIAARLQAQGLDVQEQTVKVWESNADRRPSPYNLEGLERIFESQAPRTKGSDQSELIAALTKQTEAIGDLVKRLDGLASQAIREGVLDALREAGVIPAGGESQSEQPPGQQP